MRMVLTEVSWLSTCWRVVCSQGEDSSNGGEFVIIDCREAYEARVRTVLTEVSLLSLTAVRPTRPG